MRPQKLDETQSSDEAFIEPRPLRIAVIEPRPLRIAVFGSVDNGSWSRRVLHK